MSQIFISFSNDIDFATDLQKRLEESGFDVWIYLEDIPPTVDWLNEIYDGIEKSDIFLFLLSPDSIKSETCHKEIDCAVKNGKRIIPLLVKRVDFKVVRQEISKIQVISFENESEFNIAFEELIIYINKDFTWVKFHSELQNKALAWERAKKDTSRLLRGKELQEAKQQLDLAGSQPDPLPTTLQHQFILVSQNYQSRLQRRNAIGLFLGLFMITMVSFFAKGQWDEATSQRETAQAESTAGAEQALTAQAANTQKAEQALTAQAAKTLAVEKETLAAEQKKIADAGKLAEEALSEKDHKFDLALLLGIEGFHRFDYSSTRSALLALTDSNPRLEALLSAHQSYVTSIAFDPFDDPFNQRLATGSADGTIILWDISNPVVPSKLATLRGNRFSVTSIALYGDFLASGGWDKTIILWDVSNPTAPSKIATLMGHDDYVESIAFRPGGGFLLASGSRDGIIILWDVFDPNTPKLATLRGHDSSVNSLTFSPDGDLLASGSLDGTVILWDVSWYDPFSWEENNQGTFSELAKLNSHNFSVETVSFSPRLFDRLLAAGGSDGSITLWDISNVEAPSELATITGHSDWVKSVAFNQDSELLASGGDDDTIILWDVRIPNQPTKFATLTGHSANVNSVAFSSDGNFLASGSDDNKIILWDVENWYFNTPSTPFEQTTLRGNIGWVTSVAFSPNSEGKRLLASSSSGGDIVLRNLDNPDMNFEYATLTGYDDAVESVAFNSEGNLLASGGDDSKIILWDVSNPETPSEYATLQGHDDTVESVAFNSEGNLLASGSDDGTVILWEISDPEASFELTALQGHTDFVKSVAFSPDGNLLASGSWDGTIILWDVSDPDAPSIYATLTGHKDVVESIAFNPDGDRLASGSDDRNVILWDISNPASPSLIATLTGHNDFVESVAFSQDGNLLASGSDDNKIILWDVSDPDGPSKLTILTGHTDFVESVAFSLDGNLLASGSDDGRIILWDLDPESLVDKACQRAGRNLTQDEWQQYFLDEDYHRTCPQWPAGE